MNLLMNNCIFCKIASGKASCYKLAENDHAMAFLDANPIANGHTIIISKQHYPDWQSTPINVLNDMVVLSKKVIDILEKKLKPWGFNYLSNQGKIAGQAILHVHLHVIPKYYKYQGFKLSHYDINVIPIAKIAKKLKIKNIFAK